MSHMRFPLLVPLLLLVFVPVIVVAAEIRSAAFPGLELCKTCHGDAGGGNRELSAPSLAGLQPWYIVNQLRAFKAGLRGADGSYEPATNMATAVAPFTEADLESLVPLITAWATPLPDDPPDGDVRAGEAYYHHQCGACHGPGAKGNEQMGAPALAGLQSWYLFDQLNQFTTGTRGTHPDDVLGAQMVFIMKKQSAPDQWQDIAAYIRRAAE